MRWRPGRVRESGLFLDVGRDHDDQTVQIFIAVCLQYGIAVEHRHGQVEKHYVDIALTAGGQRLLAVRGLADADVPMRGQSLISILRAIDESSATRIESGIQLPFFFVAPCLAVYGSASTGSAPGSGRQAFVSALWAWPEHGEKRLFWFVVAAFFYSKACLAVHD